MQWVFTVFKNTCLGIPVHKGDVRREISLKVIGEKVKFSNSDFCNNVRNYEWSYIISNIQDVQTKGKG